MHVHTTAGQRVSYRPYLAASSELHGVLASAELASILAGSDRADGVVVEKASIDEAYVQLPTGSDLATDGARYAGPRRSPRTLDACSPPTHCSSPLPLRAT